LSSRLETKIMRQDKKRFASILCKTHLVRALW
jgi:hypothetical protein